MSESIMEEGKLYIVMGPSMSGCTTLLIPGDQDMIKSQRLVLKPRSVVLLLNRNKNWHGGPFRYRVLYGDQVGWLGKSNLSPYTNENDVNPL